MDCRPSGSSVYGISQSRVLKWVAISSFRGSFRSMDGTQVSYIRRWVLYHWASRKAQIEVSMLLLFNRTVVLTLCDPMDCSTPRFPVLRHLPESIESVMPSNRLILCHPLLLPSVLPSIRVFSESALHIRWPKYWSFSFGINPSNEYSGLISFRIDWFDLLAVQGTLKSLLQHHSSTASNLQCSAEVYRKINK